MSGRGHLLPLANVAEQVLWEEGLRLVTSTLFPSHLQMLVSSQWRDYELTCKLSRPASSCCYWRRKQEFYPMAIGIIGIGDRLTWKKFYLANGVFEWQKRWL